MIRKWWSHIALKPELLFLLFAIPYGLVFIFLIPPLGGSDEGLHLQRVASIGYFQILNKPFMAPTGIPDFLMAGIEFYGPVKEPPYAYSFTQWQKFSSISLNAAQKVYLDPLPVTIHHPFSYVPQIAAFMLTAAAGLPPIAILYACRLAGFAAGTYMIWLAIRLMPTSRYMLCAIALLPTMTFYRSYVNADAFTNGLAFVFIALILREITGKGEIAKKSILLIAAIAFVMAQAKNAYLLMPFLTLAIPPARFSSARTRINTLALITLPGLLASLAWMLVIKQSYFGGVNYHTWGGEANPELQTQFILSHPFTYLGTLISTLLFTLTIPDAITGMFNDIGLGYVLPLPCILPLIFFFLKSISLDRSPIHYSPMARMLGTGVFLGSMLISLTILYIQWTGLQAPIIKGFQGRYFYPVLPFITLYMEPVAEVPNPQKSASYVALLAIFGLSASIVKAWLNYY